MALIIATFAQIVQDGWRRAPSPRLWCSIRDPQGKRESYMKEK